MLIGIDGNEANVLNRVGSNIYAFQLLKWMKKIANENSFTIYLKSDPLNDLPESSQKWNYRVLKSSLLWTRWRLPLDLYLHHPRPNMFFTPGHYAPVFCPLPLAISIMDLSYLHFPKMFKKQDLFRLKKWTEESIKKADHIFTISQFNKNDIIKNYSIDERIITVTYPGIDDDLSQISINKDDVEATKTKFGIKDNFILYIGTLQPRKNLNRLFKAFHNLEDKSIKLVIIGKKGWHYKSIFKQVNKLGLSEKIITTDYISEKEKIILLKSAKCLVLVSLYEGFGLPVIEAMAMGIPVVISDNSSLPEIAGDAGIKVDPYDVGSITNGLTSAIQLNEFQRKEITEKYKEQLKKFSWEKSARKTLEDLYELAV